MGMAASQARYLSLVARKTNVEWEGQQINQSRTALANKTASLFNQMLGMQVPDCPDCTDFTNVQYSFSDGLNASVIDKYYQLSSPDPEYNYVVTHHYNTNVYTGSVKKLNDPQVSFGDTNYVDNFPARIDTEQYADAVNSRLRLHKEWQVAALEVKDRKAEHPTYVTDGELGGVRASDSLTPFGDGYRYFDASISKQYTFLKINNTNFPDKMSKIEGDLQAFLDAGTFADKIEAYRTAHPAFDGSDMDALKDILIRDEDGDYAVYDQVKTIADATEASQQISHVPIITYNTNEEVAHAEEVLLKAKAAYDANEAVIKHFHDTFKVNPKYVGNCELTELHNPLTDDEMAELSQCVKDFNNNNYQTFLQEYFVPDEDTPDYFPVYDYVGEGVYKFTLNGVTQYTTMADLAMSYINANDPPGNDIDSQVKLEYYNASYIETPIEKTERALLETDGQGRFKSVRFEDDSVTYTLNCETKVNEEAYNDAMNQYYHDVYLYEKAIADINAKTEIIQNQDRTLELRLKQLDTEQSALTNEIDAVKKVLKDNIEKSFKTFGE